MEVEQEHPTGICGVSGTFCQWSFQEPKLIGGTYHRKKAYFSGLNFREYPHNSYSQTYGTNVPLYTSINWILKLPLNHINHT